jgi:ferredoxin
MALDRNEISIYRCPLSQPVPRNEGAAKETKAMEKFTICLENTGEHYTCADNRSVLEGMEALGRKGIPVGCRQGGCGVCKVQVLEGTFSRRVMSRAHVSAEEEARGCVLSCRIYPRSDLRLNVVGAMKKTVCRPVAAPLFTNP